MNNGGNNTLFSLVPFFRIFAAIFLFSLHSSAAAAEPEQLWTTAGSFSWVHKISDTQTPFRAHLNGEPLANQKQIFVNHKGFIHALIKLIPFEENALEIKQGDKTLYIAKLYQAPYFKSELVPGDFNPLIFHQKDNEAVCKECHRLTVQDKDYQPATVNDSLCYLCHKHNFLDLPYKHTDVTTKWLCLKCHQPEFAENDTLPDTVNRFSIQEGDATAPLCFQCHAKKKNQIEQHENIHGPIGMEGCSLCHNAHGSQRRNLLEQEASTLCIECHELQDMLEEPYVHRALTQKGCTACHDPHSSNFTYQLVAETTELCYTCHVQIKKQKNNHPVNGHPVSAKKDPLNPDVPFTCTSCHSPHSSENEKLLPESETMMVCVRCHPM